MSKKKKCVVLYCLYNTSRFKDSMIWIHAIFDLAGLDPYIVCISNSMTENDDIVCQVDVYLNHDNTNWEFGAWEVGMEYMRKNIQQVDAIILTNDTFGLHYPINSKLISKYAEGLVHTVSSEKEAASGFKDKFSELFTLNQITANYWLRTSFLVINMKAMQSIKWRIADYNECSKYINEDGVREDLINEKLDPKLKLHLVGWLFPDINDKAYWYGAKDKDKINSGFMSQKIKSILQEMLLSRRLIESKTHIFDVNRVTIFERLLRYIKRVIK